MSTNPRRFILALGGYQKVALRLGKPDFYVLHRDGRNTKAEDVLRALRLGTRAVLWAALFASAALLGLELEWKA